MLSKSLSRWFRARNRSESARGAARPLLPACPSRGRGFTADLTTLTAAADATSYSDTGLTAGTTYYYRIRSTNAEGDSASTDAASASTLLPAPTDLSALPRQDGSIVLLWTNNSSPGTSYQIERWSGSDGPWTQIGIISGSTFLDDLNHTPGSAYSYRIRAEIESSTGQTF